MHTASASKIVRIVTIVIDGRKAWNIVSKSATLDFSAFIDAPLHLQSFRKDLFLLFLSLYIMLAFNKFYKMQSQCSTNVQWPTQSCSSKRNQPLDSICSLWLVSRCAPRTQKSLSFHRTLAQDGLRKKLGVAVLMFCKLFFALTIS